MGYKQHTFKLELKKQQGRPIMRFNSYVPNVVSFYFVSSWVLVNDDSHSSRHVHGSKWLQLQQVTPAMQQAFGAAKSQNEIEFRNTDMSGA